MEERQNHCYSEMIQLPSFVNQPLLQLDYDHEETINTRNSVKKNDNYSALQKMNRIQRIIDAYHKLNTIKQSYKVELEISIILLREMKRTIQLQKIMTFSTLLDIIIRLNNYIYLIIFVTRLRDNGITMLIYLLFIPRLFFQLSLIKIFFRKLHLYRNQPILMIIILFRQNFTNLNMANEAEKEWYDWQYETSQYKRKELLLFFFTPVELTYFQLKNKEHGLETYLVSNFILDTIEVVMFIPIMLLLLNFNEYLFNTKFNLSIGYDQFTLVLVYIYGIKYIFITVFYLTKRNYQINKF